MTLREAAMNPSALIGTREMHELAGGDRYAINIMAKEKKPYMGVRLMSRGKKNPRAYAPRAAFLRALGYEGPLACMGEDV